jgi:hypothetical protein
MLDHGVAIFSAAIAFAGLLLVAVQLHRATQQREAEALVKIYDVNRELLSLGFTHPQLFAILQDEENVDPIWQRRYLQLWLNHLSLLHLYLTHSVFAAELEDSESHALAEFMTLKNMRRHWQKNGEFYPVSFQKRVNAIIEKGEPLDAAHRDSSAKHLSGDFLERGARHSHEVFSRRSGKHGSGVRAGDEALDEHIASVGNDGRRTRAAIAQFGKLPIFSNYFFDRHNVIFRMISLLKQNYTNCFNPGWGGAFV